MFDKVEGNQHLWFVAEIWTNYNMLPLSDKNYKFHKIAANKLPFKGMNMSWSLEEDVWFGIFKKKRQQFK